MRLALLALPFATFSACATTGYPVRSVAPPATDAARDDYAVYSAVIAQLTHVFAAEKLASWGPLELLVADQTYTCEGGTAAVPGRTMVARFPRRATRGPGIGLHFSPRFNPGTGGSQPSLRVMPIDSLDSFEWLTQAAPGPRLALYFSAVVYLDAARDSAVVQVMSGRTRQELSCATWLLERIHAVVGGNTHTLPSRQYRYVRGHSRSIKSTP